jgi:hypothetical protein
MNPNLYIWLVRGRKQEVAGVIVVLAVTRACNAAGKHALTEERRSTNRRILSLHF